MVSELVRPRATVLLALTPARASSYTTRADQIKKFRPGTYAWRVQALDAQGQVIGESPLTHFVYGSVR